MKHGADANEVLRGVLALLAEAERRYRHREASNDADSHLRRVEEITGAVAGADGFSNVKATTAVQSALREAVKAEKKAREATSEASSAKHELEATLAFIKRLEFRLKKNREKATNSGPL